MNEGLLHNTGAGAEALVKRFLAEKGVRISFEPARKYPGYFIVYPKTIGELQALGLDHNDFDKDGKFIYPISSIMMANSKYNWRLEDTKVGFPKLDLDSFKPFDDDKLAKIKIYNSKIGPIGGKCDALRLSGCTLTSKTTVSGKTGIISAEYEEIRSAESNTIDLAKLYKCEGPLCFDLKELTAYWDSDRTFTFHENTCVGLTLIYAFDLFEKNNPKATLHLRFNDQNYILYRGKDKSWKLKKHDD